METLLKYLSQLQWPILICIVLFWLRKEISSISRSLAFRLKSGASIKVASIEIGATYVSSDGSFEPKSSKLENRPDTNEVRYNQRKQHYKPNRGIMLVHRISPSKHEGQLYDILIYLIPHKKASLIPISKVEYYFGEYWGNKIFTVNDRSRNFPIATSAYGPFVCTAELFFSDGTSCILSRYIDFEMGSAGAA
jgi:hypothetical protein